MERFRNNEKIKKAKGINLLPYNLLAFTSLNPYNICPECDKSFVDMLIAALYLFNIING
jgi:hypothetical protein